MDDQNTLVIITEHFSEIGDLKNVNELVILVVGWLYQRTLLVSYYYRRKDLNQEK